MIKRLPINIIKRDKKGVTLVELIVTMGIMTLVIIMIYSFFLLSNSLSKINSEKADAQAQTRLILQGLQKEIETSNLVMIGNTDAPEDIMGLNNADYAYYVDGNVLKRRDAYNNVTIPFGNSSLDVLAVSYEKVTNNTIKIQVFANEESAEYLVHTPNVTDVTVFGIGDPQYTLIIKEAI